MALCSLRKVVVLSSICLAPRNSAEISLGKYGVCRATREDTDRLNRRVPETVLQFLSTPGGVDR